MITYHGAVPYLIAQQAQQAADMLLSIEPQGAHPLAASFLPSKILDALALGKPLIALTPEASETAALCREGFGWAVSPGAPEAIASLLAECICTRAALRDRPALEPPARFLAATVADELLMQIARLTARLPL